MESGEEEVQGREGVRGEEGGVAVGRRVRDERLLRAKRTESRRRDIKGDRFSGVSNLVMFKGEEQVLSG